MMTSAQVVETSVNVTSNSPSQDYTHPDDHNLPNYDMTPGFKPFTENVLQISHWTLTAIRYTSMRSLFSVVLKIKFFNTFYLLLIITCDHLIRRFRTPPKRGTKLYRIVEG